MTFSFDLEERLLSFAAEITDLVRRLPKDRVSNHIGGQLLRSGTSPLANHGEAEYAESRRDFVHKLRVCLKEMSESKRWLLLIRKSQLVSVDVGPLIREAVELVKIFAASVRTATRNKSAETTSDEQEVR